MKREKPKRGPRFALTPEICKAILLLGALLGGIMGGIFSLCRLFSTSRMSTINEKTGDIVLQYDTILPFEPSNSFFPLFWVAVSFILLLISVLYIVHIALLDPYYDRADFIFYGSLVAFSLAIITFGILLPSSIVVKNDVSSQTFEIATEHVYGQDAQKSDVYQIGDYSAVAKINQHMSKVSAKNSGDEDDLAFNIKNDKNDAIYPIFQVVQVNGEPHLIVSENLEIDNVNELRDLGKVTPTQVSDITKYLS